MMGHFPDAGCLDSTLSTGKAKAVQPMNWEILEGAAQENSIPENL